MLHNNSSSRHSMPQPVVVNGATSDAEMVSGICWHNAVSLASPTLLSSS